MGNCCKRSRKYTSTPDWAFSERHPLTPPSPFFIVFGQNKLGNSFLTSFLNSSNKLEFVKTNSLPRFYNYSGVTMKNSRILIICGGIQHNLDTIARDCLEFDLISLTFKKLPDMLNLRYTFPVVYFRNKIFVLGGRVYGEDEVSILNECECFSYAKNEWTTIAPMNLKRCTASAFVYRDKIWVVGGYSGNFIRSKLIESYDPDTNIWKIESVKLLQGFENGNIACHPTRPNELIIFGGKLNQGGSKRVWTYNLRDETVINNRIVGCEAVLSKIQFKAGDRHEALIIAQAPSSQNNSGEMLSYSIYDLDSMKSTLLPMHSLRSLHSSLEKFKQYNYNCSNIEISFEPEEQKQERNLLNHSLIFGTDLEPFQIEIDSKTGAISVSPIPLKLKLRQNQMCQRFKDGKVFMAGGTNSVHTKIYSSAFIYDPNDGAVERLPSMLNPRYMSSAVILNDHVYVVGGRDYGHEASSYLKYCERFSLERRVWEPLPPLNVSRCSASGFLIDGRVFVAGGLSAEPGAREKSLGSIEVLNLARDCWELLGPTLHKPLYGFLSIVRNKKMFYFGGHCNEDTDGKFQLDFSFGDLSKATPLNDPFLSKKATLHKAFPVGNSVILFGGTDINHMEILSTENFRSAEEVSGGFEVTDEKLKASELGGVNHFKEELIETVEKVWGGGDTYLRGNSWVGPTGWN